jgi:hypothetical protein
MLIRWVVALFAVGIVYCLGSAAYALVRTRDGSALMLRSLSWRIAASVALFLLILLSYYAGWIHPRPAKFLLKLETAQQSLVQAHSHAADRENHHGSALS